MYYLNEQDDLVFDDEAHWVEIDNITDDETSLASKRPPSRPFTDYEAEETRNSYESDDNEAKRSPSKKPNAPKILFNGAVNLNLHINSPSEKNNIFIVTWKRFLKLVSEFNSWKILYKKFSLQWSWQNKYKSKSCKLFSGCNELKMKESKLKNWLIVVQFPESNGVQFRGDIDYKCLNLETGLGIWSVELLYFWSFSKLSARNPRITYSVLQAGPKDPKQRRRKFLSLNCCSAIVDRTIEAKEANDLRQLRLVKC